MTPLLISGITSVASSAIDAWTNAANRRVVVEQAKFDNAINRAMGLSAASTSVAPTAQSLETQLRNAPEIRGVLEAQDPTRSASLQVSAEGRVFLHVPGNQPAELTVSLETRELARQLNSALNGHPALNSASLNSATPLRSFSSPSVGTLAPYAR